MSGMEHVTRNINMRRAQLDVTLADLDEASGMSRQSIWRVKEHPGAVNIRSLQRMALILFVPLSALVSEEPGAIVQCDLPPIGWLETIKTHRALIGFHDRDAYPISWRGLQNIMGAEADWYVTSAGNFMRGTGPDFMLTDAEAGRE